MSRGGRRTIPTAPPKRGTGKSLALPPEDYDRFMQVVFVPFPEKVHGPDEDDWIIHGLGVVRNGGKEAFRAFLAVQLSSRDDEAILRMANGAGSCARWHDPKSLRAFYRRALALIDDPRAPTAHRK